MRKIQTEVKQTIFTITFTTILALVESVVGILTSTCLLVCHYFFCHAGEIGDWKNWFTVAESEAFDKLIQDKLPPSEQTFVYE